MALPDSAEAGPLLPTLSQIHSWRTTHLVTAAEHWNAAAKSWENSYTAVYQAVQQPGGQPWEGDAAHTALNRAHSDRTKVLLAVDNLNFAGATARNGAAEIDAARSRVLSAVAAARNAGFDVEVPAEGVGSMCAAERRPEQGGPDVQSGSAQCWLPFSTWRRQPIVLWQRQIRLSAHRLRTTASDWHRKWSSRHSSATGAT